MDLADLVPARVVIRRIAASPLAHFVLLGALLFGAQRALPRFAGNDPIRLSAAEVLQLQAQWQAETGRAPVRVELDALVRRYADEELLVREALRLGLDRTDPVVRTRLAMNMRFAGTPGDEDTLLRAARALGMPRHDPVVRRRLIEAMGERFAAGVRLADAEVRAYVDAHPERYGVEPRVGFRHVFVSADLHGANLERDAQALRAHLPQAVAAADGGAAIGDPFLLGNRFAPMSVGQLGRTFGPSFAAAVAQAPAGQWSGPIASTYGLHYVFVEQRLAAADAEYGAVRRQAYYALLEEREQGAVQSALDALRPRYPVEIGGSGMTVASAP